jgi:hypothetical protein
MFEDVPARSSFSRQALTLKETFIPFHGDFEKGGSRALSDSRSRPTSHTGEIQSCGKYEALPEINPR